MTTEIRGTLRLVEEERPYDLRSDETLPKARSDLHELILFFAMGFACLVPLLLLVGALAGWLAVAGIMGASIVMGALVGIFAAESDKRQHAKLRRQRRVLVFHDSEVGAAAPDSRDKAS